MSQQADIWASLESSGDKEAMYHATMKRLQNMESAYEILGTTILQSLKEVQRMEEEFHVLQTELVSNGCPLMAISQKKSKKSHKGKKKGASSDSDGINSGSSQSESSSAQSSSRPMTTQAEEIKVASTPSEQTSNKAADGKSATLGGKTDSKSASKMKKKKAPQKTEKKKEGKAEENNDDVSKKRLMEDVLTPVQASSPSVLPSVPEAAPLNTAASLNVAAKDDIGGAHNAGEGPNIVLSEDGGSSTSAAIEGAQMKEGAKALNLDLNRQSVDGRPIISEPSRSSKVDGDLLGVENKLIVPKVSLNFLDVKSPDLASVQNLPKSKRKSRRLSSAVTKDETVQTDDVAILALEDCDVDALPLREYQAADVKDLLEKMKKLQKQLQFWRTKNWAEKHTGQGHMMPPPTYNQFIKVDASPDMGMLCYYNSRTGVHVMKNVAELDTSMQESIMHLVGGPGQSPKTS